MRIFRYTSFSTFSNRYNNHNYQKSSHNHSQRDNNQYLRCQKTGTIVRYRCASCVFIFCCCIGCVWRGILYTESTKVGFFFCVACATSSMWLICLIFLQIYRFAVEVADFNFGETSSVDVEYKTFHQRLFDSIRTMVRRPSNSDASGSESSLKYGSMTWIVVISSFYMCAIFNYLYLGFL